MDKDKNGEVDYEEVRSLACTKLDMTHFQGQGQGQTSCAPSAFHHIRHSTLAYSLMHFCCRGAVCRASLFSHQGIITFLLLAAARKGMGGRLHA